MNHKRWAALICVFGVLACGKPQSGGAPHADHEEMPHESPYSAAVDIPPTVRNNLGITFAPVELRRVAHTLRIPGSFELLPLARQEYRASLPGQVDLLVDQYDTVEKGQVLYRFLSPQWPELLHEIIEGEQTMAAATSGSAVAAAYIVEAQSKVATLEKRIAKLAQAEIKRADLELQLEELQASLPRLEAERAATVTRLENAKSTHEHALHRASTASRIPEESLTEPVEVNGETLLRYHTIEWIEVRAEAGGVVEGLHVTDGAFVESSDAVLTTVDPNQVRFHGLALQSDLTSLMRTESARIVPPQSVGMPIGEKVSAQVHLGLEGLPKERLMAVYAVPESTRTWGRPGMTAFLEVDLDASAGEVMAIPSSAILQDGLTHVFFRRDPKDPNKAIRTEADMGTSDGRWVELASGVAVGEEVVLNGAFELKLATERGGGTPKGGHFHADGSFHADDH